MILTGTALLAAGFVAMGLPFLLLASRPCDGRAHRIALAFTSGSLLMWIALQALETFGVPWSQASVSVLLVIGCLAGVPAVRLLRPAEGRTTDRPGWGHLVVGAALLAVSAATVMAWSVNPDFIYHWGIKGHRFFLAGGIDDEFLGRSWNLLRHPDYPNFLPGIFAATAAIEGRFQVPSSLAWSTLHLLVLLVSARETLARTVTSRWLRELTLATVAMSTVGFSLGYLLLGGPDPLLAAVPLLAWPALLGEAGRRSDLQIGLAGALAAASKIEGIPLAVALAIAGALRHSRRRLVALGVILLPTLVLCVIWFVHAANHQLLVESRTGPFAWRDLEVVLRSAVRGARTPEFHGATLAFAALPWMLAHRQSRAIAAVLLTQAAFFFYVYLTWPASTSAERDFFVSSNCPRLMFQLLPATLVGCGILFDRLLGATVSRGAAAPSREPAAGA